jgi:glyoxylase-like metal-dependent hydrolase (beta-lactamase superfamily II)
MRVHHINAATMCPPSAALVNGRGGLFERARLVCHVLLVEAPWGLVLIDTGLGTDDLAQPSRLGATWLRLVSPRFDAAQPAVAGIRALGLSPDDVRDVVVTHLDRDHAGGIADFPHASIHVHAREHAAATTPRPGARERYLADQWSHQPKWRPFDDGGESWFGFEGVRPLNDSAPDILLVPLPGHTLGHTGVAVRAEERWLLHAGDSYYFHGQLADPPTVPLGLRLFQRLADTNHAERVANQEKVRALRARHGDEVTIFCAHDPVELDRELPAAGS